MTFAVGMAVPSFSAQELLLSHLSPSSSQRGFQKWKKDHSLHRTTERQKCKLFLVSERSNKISLAGLLWISIWLVSQPVTCCCDESLVAKNGSLTTGMHKSITGLHKGIFLLRHNSEPVELLP